MATLFDVGNDLNRVVLDQGETDQGPYYLLTVSHGPPNRRTSVSVMLTPEQADALAEAIIHG